MINRKKIFKKNNQNPGFIEGVYDKFHILQ